jgi:hypothetical protein
VESNNDFVLPSPTTVVGEDGHVESGAFNPAAFVK